MPELTKPAVLVALAVVSVGLSVASFGLRPVQAQWSLPQDYWVADDAPRAVNTLMATARFTYLDQAMVPGMYRNAPLPLTFKAIRSKPAGVKISAADGSVGYLASRPKSKLPYETKNAYPKILWTPTVEDGLPKIQLKGEGGTKFQKLERKSDLTAANAPEGNSKLTSMPVKTDRGSKRADKLAFVLKSDDKTGKIAVTKAQLRAFKSRIKAAKRDGDASASAVFIGQLDNELATFVPIVRVRKSMVTDFRIGITQTR